jgi:hypothetical protein
MKFLNLLFAALCGLFALASAEYSEYNSAESRLIIFDLCLV